METWEISLTSIDTEAWGNLVNGKQVNATGRAAALSALIATSLGTFCQVFPPFLPAAPLLP